jgi:uncharacterized membrane protein
MSNTKFQKLCRAAVIGALYAVVTLLLAPISYGNIQCRVSEALCILPWFFPETAWGLFAGCFLANLLGGNGPLDVIFGSLATLIAGLITARMKLRGLALLPPIVVNAVMVGALLAWVITPGAFWASYPIFALEVGAGEAVVMYVLGLPLSFVLERIPYVKKYGVKHGKNP